MGGEMRTCGCGSDDLENANVTGSYFVVLCHGCGCLGVGGSSHEQAQANWDAGKVSRPVGYNGSEEHQRSMWKSGSSAAAFWMHVSYNSRVSASGSSGGGRSAPNKWESA